ncbi:MAG: hypothetical protein AAF366_04135 [Pseudomonadota bacterium]
MTDPDLTASVIEALHASPDAWRSLVRDIGTGQPDLPARILETALLSAARGMDAAIRRAGAPTDEARTARRLAMLLGMDIDRHGGDPTMGDLMGSWRETDDFFLRL